MSAVAMSLYLGIGFTMISATHSYFCKYFHDGEKRFGLTFDESSGLRTHYRHGYVGAVFLGVFTFSMSLNYFSYFFDSPSGVSEVSVDWIIGLLVLGAFWMFIVSPLLGGGAAIKWVLEGTLITFVLLLILSVPAPASTFSQVQFVFSVSGAVLSTIYLGWLKIYILDNENVNADSLRGVLGTFQDRDTGVWALWGTVVYYVFSGTYILVGYVLLFAYIN